MQEPSRILIFGQVTYEEFPWEIVLTSHDLRTAFPVPLVAYQVAPSWYRDRLFKRHRNAIAMDRWTKRTP